MRLEPSELFYLATFLHPRKVDVFPIMERTDWHACLGRSPEETANLFRDNKLIERASPVLHLEKRFRKAELEKLLLDRKLSSEGTKAEMALRLLRADDSGVLNLLGDFELLECTEEGSALATAYLNSIASGNIPEGIVKSLGSNRAKLAVLWIASAAAAGIIENNADRIFMHLVEIFSAREQPEFDAERQARESEGELQLSPEDWDRYYAIYELPVVIFVRLCLACYARGEGCPGLNPDSGLADFDKLYYGSKFIVLSLNQNPYGGVNLYLMFQDKPDKVFVAWVYKLGDEEDYNEFELRGFWEHEMTQGQIAQHNRQMRKFLEDRVHAM